MANVINDNIITHYMEDVISTYKIHDLNGNFIKDVELPVSESLTVLVVTITNQYHGIILNL